MCPDGPSLSLPKYWRWTLIWCMRPVKGLQRTTDVLPLKLRRSNSVRHSLPLGDTLHTPILYETTSTGCTHSEQFLDENWGKVG